MFFVALRRIENLTPDERPDFLKNLHLFETQERQLQDRYNRRERPEQYIRSPSKLLFAEIYVRFHKEYSSESTNEWDIAYYKVASFDVLHM